MRVTDDPQLRVCDRLVSYQTIGVGHLHGEFISPICIFALRATVVRAHICMPGWVDERRG